MDATYSPPTDPLVILHDDADVIAVDKPAGLLSVPGRGEHLADCLITRVQKVFPHALLVHRLDRDTSGVMIFGLNPHAQRTLSTQFQERQTKKMYVARVWGVPEEKMGTVDLPLIVDWPNRPLQMVCHETGKPSVTDWRLLKDQGETARIRLIPKTGRTHQLRLHMLALGYPILGDPFYGHAESQAYPRMMLHSEELRVKHPENGQSLRVRAKPPF
jgi:tRNA pseudouridine32 synthase/23S rRNA pseudouridine746 synthase